MDKIELTIPEFQESVHQVQLIRYTKRIGDSIHKDEVIAEVLSDTIDTALASTHTGVISKFLFKEGAKIPVGAAFAYLEPSNKSKFESENVFLSPLVKKLILENDLSLSEASMISGTGKNGRISKGDVLEYLKSKKSDLHNSKKIVPSKTYDNKEELPINIPKASVSGTYDILEMDKLRRDHAIRMQRSKNISPHVTSFVEADVTDLVHWQQKYKIDFGKKFNQNFTITPLLVMAVARAIQDFPLINVSVDTSETKILRHHDINIGVATELPNGNLITPVIKGANHYNIEGLALKLNDLVERSRNGKLELEDMKGGTFTVSNVGVFGNLMGTPIINQPEVAILATGVIKKKPAVVETELGDVIAIRQFMFLSLSFDHRVVDGSLGGAFLKRIADYLERWNLHNQL